ncbi:murein transglycosylase A [Sulfurimonas sp.]
MKVNIVIITIVLFLFGCAKEPKVLFSELPYTHLQVTAFSKLPNINAINFDGVLDDFINTCKSKKAQKLYGTLCLEAPNAVNAKTFILKNFKPYLIVNKDGNKNGLLTGYYEPELHASLVKDAVYKYPLYNTPNDLISVDLSSIYPELKHYRLRGKIKGNKLVPYDSRGEIKRSDINASVICYCDSKIDRFFLEVQGSGKVILDNNRTIFVGYNNQNGYKYKSIGKYLVKKNEIPLKDISLQSIRKWLESHPDRVDEVLNYNKAMVFFSKRKQGATGALGLQLRAKSSIAVDSKYIPLGSMLYLNSKYNNKKVDNFVFAQDVGGAIKGPLRADYFLGSGKRALSVAGSLKAPLNLWIILPKEKRMINE